MKLSGFLKLSLLCYFSMSLPLKAEQQRPSSMTKWHPWFEIAGYHNRSDKTPSVASGNRGETTIFAPISGNESSLLFTQITAKFFADEAREGNAAIAFRQSSSIAPILGIWVGVDVRKSKIGNTFWQLSGGIEALSEDVDFRLNWYGPVTRPQPAVGGFAEVKLSGNQIYMIGGEEVALKGLDGELGFRIPTNVFGLDPMTFEFRAFGGGFYYDDADANRRLLGVTGRLEFHVNDVLPEVQGSRLTAEYKVSYDDVRQTRHDVGLRLRVPLQVSLSASPSVASSVQRLSWRDQRMLEGIRRETDITTTQSKAEPVADNLTSTNFDRVAYVANGGSITTTATAAGSNTLIIANGTVTGSQTLQANQTLQGGGATIAVRGRRSGTVAQFTAPGAPGRLTSPAADADNIVLAGSNTHVAGLTIVGTGAGVGDGVDVNSNKSNVFLTNLAISNTGGDAIDVDDNNQVTIINLNATDVGESGIDLNDANTVTVVGGVIVRAGSDGIQVEDDNVLTVSGVTIGASGGSGIALERRNVVTVSQSVIEDSGNHGIQLSGGPPPSRNTLTLNGVRVLGTFNHGVSSGANNSLTIRDSEFSDTGLRGVSVNINSDLTLTNTSFANIGSFAVRIGPNSRILVANNTFRDTIGLHAFNFVGTGTVVSAGSGGNVDATSGASLCNVVVVPNAFSGSLTFVNGVVLTSNTPPCN